MERSLKFYPSASLLMLLLVTLIACNDKAILYKRSYSEDEKLKLSETLLNSAGTSTYYQGSVSERMIIHESYSYNPDNADVQRELGVPYLKRGMAAESNKYYTQASNADPEEWLGYKVYCWLYFYRDYETVLKEVEQYDAITPDYVDYPQSTSVTYMRGISHLRLGNLDEAISFLSAHLAKEIADVGVNYVEPVYFLHLGIAYHHAGEFEAAENIFNQGLAHNKNIAELYYYKAMNQLSLGQIDLASESLDLAQEWFDRSGSLTRAYVEEFYAIYKEDLALLYLNLDSKKTPS